MEIGKMKLAVGNQEFDRRQKDTLIMLMREEIYDLQSQIQKEQDHISKKAKIIKEAE